ncbi:MAG: sarcosine oxidase subunit delta [Pseudomonadota bacterium]|jgi:sarcosine oxidase subunit delta
MLRIQCPHCGCRDETEFRYRGDASISRPLADAGEAAFVHYVYHRNNPKGWHVEWWLHVSGCRAVLRVVRHTVTHEIHSVTLPQEPVDIPWEAR